MGNLPVIKLSKLPGPFEVWYWDPPQPKRTARRAAPLGNVSWFGKIVWIAVVALACLGSQHHHPALHHKLFYDQLGQTELPRPAHGLPI